MTVRSAINAAGIMTAKVIRPAFGEGLTGGWETVGRCVHRTLNDIAYAFGKAPEHLTENNSRLYRAYRKKETLRLLLKIRNVVEAAAVLKRWLRWASHSRMEAFRKLYQKIKRHKTHIVNAIRLGMSNARIFRWQRPPGIIEI